MIFDECYAHSMNKYFYIQITSLQNVRYQKIISKKIILLISFIAIFLLLCLISYVF